MENIYKILIGMSQNIMEAVDISDPHNIEMIGIEGNETMMCESHTDIDAFVDYIRDFYNIDAFGDININVSIIYTDTDMEHLHYLYQQFWTVSGVNVIQAEQILPFVSLSMGLLDDKDNFVSVGLMEQHYIIKKNADKSYMCQKADSAQNEKQLRLSDLACFYYLTGSNIKSEEEIKKIHEIWDKKCKDAKNKYQTEMTKKIKKYEQEETLLKNRIKKLEEDISGKKKDGNRHFVMYPNMKNIVRHTSAFVSVLVDSYDMSQYKLMRQYNSGELVNKGDILVKIVKVSGQSATIGAFRSIIESQGNCTSDSDTVSTISAEHSGRVFWLDDTSASETADKKLAVIGDKDDTTEDIKDWLKRMDYDVPVI